jgi:hypothetical protein
MSPPEQPNPEEKAFLYLQRLATQYRDLIAIAPALQQISSLKNAKAEAQAALDEVRAKIAAEREQHEAALAAERKRIIDQADVDPAGHQGGCRGRRRRPARDDRPRHGRGRADLV